MANVKENGSFLLQLQKLAPCPYCWLYLHTSNN